MSVLELSPEHAPSMPQATPYKLALAAQKAIKDHQDKAGYEAGLIRQLMIGRHVRLKDDDAIWLVQEVRMTLGWRAVLHGKARGRRRQVIGAITDVEIVTSGSDK